MPTHQIHHETPHHQPPNPPKTSTNPRKLLLFLLKCIVMSCILSLFLLFLSFAALVLLHFLFLTTASRRRRTNSPARIVNRVNLPEIMYENISDQLETRETRYCAICLEGFKEGESCRSLPSCGHLFHMVCVDSWLIKVPNCPVCRTRVRLGAQERSLIMSDDDWKIWWAVGN